MTTKICSTLKYSITWFYQHLVFRYWKFGCIISTLWKWKIEF